MNEKERVQQKLQDQINSRLENLKKQSKGRKPYTTKKIAQINPRTGEVVKIFKSAKEAAEEFNTSPSSLSLACHGKSKQVAGFLWMYTGEKHIHEVEED